MHSSKVNRMGWCSRDDGRWRYIIAGFHRQLRVAHGGWLILMMRVAGLQNAQLLRLRTRGEGKGGGGEREARHQSGRARSAAEGPWERHRE